MLFPSLVPLKLVPLKLVPLKLVPLKELISPALDVRRHRAWMRVAIALCVLAIAWGCSAPTARAFFVQTQEPPDVTLVRSRHAFQDLDRHSWQAIVFKRVRESGSDRLLLRLVGYPDVVAFDRERPLTVKLDPSSPVYAPQDMGRLAADAPELPNVGQFDITELAQSLPSDRALRIALPLASGADTILRVPPYLQKEWRKVADFHL
ncbi:MAG: DUF3122 domain-containing protein [Cyanobacteria bacterium J06639_1]